MGAPTTAFQNFTYNRGAYRETLPLDVTKKRMQVEAVDLRHVSEQVFLKKGEMERAALYLERALDIEQAAYAPATPLGECLRDRTSRGESLRD